MANKKRKAALVAACLLAAALLLTACGSSAAPGGIATHEGSVPAASTPAAAPALEGAYTPGIDADGGMYTEPTAEEAGGGAPAKTTNAELHQPADGRKVILNADITMEALDFDATCSALLTAVQEAGGHLASSSLENGNTTYRHAHYTVRVPATQYGAFLGALGQAGNVLSRSETSDDITAQYVDVEARLTALSAQEEQLLRLMEQAENMEDIIAIQAKLTDVRYEIESYTATKRTFDELVAYSTINISVSEVQQVTPPQPDSYLTRAGRTFTNMLHNTKTFFQNLGIFLIAALPLLLFLLIVGLVLFIVLRRQGKKRRAMQAAWQTGQAGAPTPATSPVQPSPPAKPQNSPPKTDGPRPKK